MASVIHYNCLNQCWYFVNSICVFKNTDGIPVIVHIIMVWRVGNSISKICLIFCKLQVILNYLKSSSLTIVLLYSHIIVAIVIILTSSGINLDNLIYNYRIYQSMINLLKPTVHMMHHHFNIQQLYALPELYLCVLYLSENKQRLVPLTA